MPAELLSAAAPMMSLARTNVAFDRADHSARLEVRSYQPNIDFLPSPAVTLLNLRPDKDGYVILSREKQHLAGTQIRVKLFFNSFFGKMINYLYLGGSNRRSFHSIQECCSFSHPRCFSHPQPQGPPDGQTSIRSLPPFHRTAKNFPPANRYSVDNYTI